MNRRKKSMLSTEEALERLMKAASPIHETESVRTHNANGRVIAESVYSRVNVPNVDNSAMDGFAVRTEDCSNEKTVLKIAQRITAGGQGRPLHKGEAARIFTGAPVPEGADAVIIQENCRVSREQVTLLVQPEAGANIRRAGDSISKDELVLEKGTCLKPQHVALAASVGLMDLPVIKRIRVAFFTTGDEVVMPGEFLRPGYVYNSNRYLLRALLENLGCIVTDYGMVSDSAEATQKALRETAGRHDLVIGTGGVSVGEEDHVKTSLETTGRLDFWQVAIKPGKPLTFGDLTVAGRPATPFIGLPGNPVSVFVTFVMFVRPFILRLMGIKDVHPASLEVRTDFSTKKVEARNEFLRARINTSGRLELFQNQNSHVLTSITWADGLIDNPPGNLIKKGDRVRFIPFSALINL